MAALDTVPGFESRGAIGRHDHAAAAAEGVDLLVLATPDDTVARVASLVQPVPSRLVCPPAPADAAAGRAEVGGCRTPGPPHR